jgi:hypothetical protein
VDVAANPFLGLVIDGLVAIAKVRKRFEHWRIIRIDHAAFLHVVTHGAVH